MTRTGTIAKLNDQFGYIRPSYGGGDVFFHTQACSDDDIAEGDIVKFQVHGPQAGRYAGAIRFIQRARRGKITRFNAAAGFGFICPDRGSTEVFVHGQASWEGDIGEGDLVEFELHGPPNGKCAGAVVKCRRLKQN